MQDVKKRVIGTIPKRGIVPITPAIKSVQLAETTKLIRQIVNVNNLNNSACGSKYFTTATILKRKISMLVDSGSQVNIISINDCHPDILGQLAPASISVSGYDGSAIPIRGVFETDVILNDIVIYKTPIFVTTGRFRAVLGTPALDQLVLNLPQKLLQKGTSSAALVKSGEDISASNFNLRAKTRTPSAKEIQVFSTTAHTIMPFSECIIAAEIENNFNGNGIYATEPHTSYCPNIIVGKSASEFCGNKRSCNLRLLNTSNQKIVIKRHQPIVNIAEVCIIEPLASHTSNENLLKSVGIGTTDPEFRQKIESLLSSYADIFASDTEPLKQTDTVKFDIDTSTAAPVAQQKYKTPYFLRDEMKRIINKNIEHGLMEPCSSPWAAPVLLVKKPNGSYRLVCDYRKLNTVTVADQYPLPCINDLVTELAKSTIFTTTDLFSGFHQIATTEAAKAKLAVTTEFGQFTWRAMPMGARNCPSVFQRLMDKCFRSMPTSSLVVYLDDILLHSRDMETHLERLEEMFTILRKNGLQLRASKTFIAKNEIQFCGYKISNGKKMANPTKVAAVLEVKPPNNKKQAQQVFGLLNYHRNFIPSFAKKAAPITKTYGGSKHFKWSNEANLALEKLKTEIAHNAMTLHIPDMTNAIFVLETDACPSGYAGALYVCTADSPHDNHSSACLRPVEYMSCQFTPAQCNYYIAEKELYAGKEALRKWSHFLLGRKFQWYTDNACVSWAHRVRSTKPRISKWLAEISEFDVTSVLKPSSQMKVTDCLSRQFGEINAIQISKNEMANLQQADHLLKQIRNFAANDRWPAKCNEALTFFKKQREKLHFGQSGELMIKNPTFKIIPPESIIPELLKTYHDETGHPGAIKAIDELERRYCWFNMKNDIQMFIQSCHFCQTSKPNLKPRHPPLGKSETPLQPYQTIAFDLTGPLSMTNRDHKYILVGIDLFSKKIYTAPLESKDSHWISQEIQRMLYANPNLPRKILTDHGREFFAISQFCEENGIIHAKSPPYHPATNGAVERANQSLKQRLFANGPSSQWDCELARITHAINCSPNSVSKITPFCVETGLSGKNPLDQNEQEPELTKNTRDVQAEVLHKIQTEKDSRVAKNANDNFTPFLLNDMVLIRNRTTKFPRYLGPYKIITIRGNGYSYELQNMDDNSTRIRPVIDIKPYYPRPESTVTVNLEEEPADQVDADQVDDNIDSDDEYDFALNFFPPEELLEHENPVNSTPPDQISTAPVMDPSESTQPENQENENMENTIYDKTDAATSIYIPPTNSNDDVDSIESDSLEIAENEESKNTSTESPDVPPRLPPRLPPRTPSPIEPPSTSPGKPSPKEKFPYKVRLYQMGDNEMCDLAAQFEISISGTIANKRRQIDQFFKTNRPEHTRTEKGVLIFNCSFDPNEPRKIGSLSSLELQAVIEIYNLPKQSYLRTDRKSLQKHVQKHFLKKYPRSNMKDGELLFGRTGAAEPRSRVGVSSNDKYKAATAIK